ncbi:hypothetical protein AID78_004758, partial [Salmonella enterica subsp. enterica serovar Java]|nr:hypothetical protein [Salmonella enterica subsp. enterica serovar Java]
MPERVCYDMQQGQSPLPEQRCQWGNKGKPCHYPVLALPDYPAAGVVQFSLKLKGNNKVVLSFFLDFYFQLTDFFQNGFFIYRLYFRLSAWHWHWHWHWH